MKLLTAKVLTDTERADDLQRLIALTAEGLDISEQEATDRLAKALTDPVQPLATTGP